MILERSGTDGSLHHDAVKIGEVKRWVLMDAPITSCELQCAMGASELSNYTNNLVYTVLLQVS